MFAPWDIKHHMSESCSDSIKTSQFIKTPYAHEPSRSFHSHSVLVCAHLGLTTKRLPSKFPTQGVFDTVCSEPDREFDAIWDAALDKHAGGHVGDLFVCLKFQNIYLKQGMSVRC